MRIARQFGRWIAGAIAASALGGCSTAILDLESTSSISKPSTSVQQASASPEQPSGRVFVLRGMMGAVFSTGMDELAAELNNRGLRASVHEREWQPVADRAIAEYKAAKGKMRILLAGHSDGADGILAMSYKLQQHGIPVALAITFDPTRLQSKPVPSNVERFINLYQSSNILGGGSARRVANFHGHFANVNLRERADIGHVTIDKVRALHEAIIPKFVQAAASGMPPNDDPVAIDYVVPKDGAIEIWDSGISIRAEQNDTVDTLATRYSVPAWSIRQINALADDAQISPGQNLIIPRNISTPATVARAMGGPLAEAPALTQPSAPQR